MSIDYYVDATIDKPFNHSSIEGVLYQGLRLGYFYKNINCEPVLNISAAAKILILGLENQTPWAVLTKIQDTFIDILFTESNGCLQISFVLGAHPAWCKGSYRNPNEASNDYGRYLLELMRLCKGNRVLQVATFSQ